jgi:putative signal transducing protein
MSERTERKLTQVAIVQFGYRHEAEFAAGFLEDAGIPFRLQIDDPAMGLSVSGAATIWVREMDAARAREVLEIEGGSTGLSLYGGSPAQPSRPGRPTMPTSAGGPDRTSDRHVSSRSDSVSLSDVASGRNAESLGDRESDAVSTPIDTWPSIASRGRALAGVGAVAALTSLRFLGVGTGPLSILAIVATLGLGAIALTGRAPRAVRDLVHALSGDAP